MENATFAIFRERKEVRRAIRKLRDLGFSKKGLWVFQARSDGSKDFPHIQGAQIKTGALVGSIVGVLVVCLFSLFLGGHVFALGSPFHFPVQNSLFITFAGIFMGAILGAAGGTLVGIGTPDPAAKRYGQYLQAGGILLSVRTDTSEKIQQAQSLLASVGGQDIHSINDNETWGKANSELNKSDPINSLQKSALN